MPQRRDYAAATEEEAYSDARMSAPVENDRLTIRFYRFREVLPLSGCPDVLLDPGHLG